MPCLNRRYESGNRPTTDLGGEPVSESDSPDDRRIVRTAERVDTAEPTGPQVTNQPRQGVGSKLVSDPHTGEPADPAQHDGVGDHTDDDAEDQHEEPEHPAVRHERDDDGADNDE